MDQLALSLLMSVPLGVFLVFSPLWRWVRLFETIIHEFGHAAVGILLGQKLKGFKIRYDTSGETNTLTYSYGVRGLLTHLSGYPAPVVLGTVSIYFTIFYDAALWFIYVYSFISVLVLIFIRNWFGFIPVILMIFIVGLSYILNNSLYTNTVVLLISSTLLVGGVRSIIHLWRKPEGSDADLIVQYLGGFTYLWVFIITVDAILSPLFAVWTIDVLLKMSGYK